MYGFKRSGDIPEEFSQVIKRRKKNTSAGEDLHAQEERSLVNVEDAVHTKHQNMMKRNPPMKMETSEISLPSSPEPPRAMEGESMITVDEWNNVEQSIDAAAKALEKEKLRRKVTNEKYRLVDETILPLTRSGSKFISIGMQPFKDYEPVIKMYNPSLTAAAVFNHQEFIEFLEKLEVTEDKIRDIPKDVMLFETRKHDVILKKGMVLQFKSTSEEDVYQSLFLQHATIGTLLALKKYFLGHLRQRAFKQKLLPDYDQFVTNVALHLMEHGNSDSDKGVDKAILTIIQDTYEHDPMLYDMWMKTPYTIKSHIEKKLSHFRST
ncbi:hypothetical protein Zmor_017523 [Zophobas morio]|uniref:Uncharacterized protein n=1 Tax=Zophobas morio TaxID=2755281 RepID=A0AA38MC90_9CUCU|nr:hypothetical protein Zmor_017523 [Zophobas morio]